MDGYVTVNEMAKRWNVSVRQVQLLCQNGKIEGASRFGNAWAIPKDTPKPTRTGKLKPGRKPKE
ncbi:MAG: helix-turn-helix domain-containing protein [Holophagaceae bacterium]|nr:helix-turn-helix domain-containing protein [Holophagaceae bacterium]